MSKTIAPTKLENTAMSKALAQAQEKAETKAVSGAIKANAKALELVAEINAANKTKHALLCELATLCAKQAPKGMPVPEAHKLIGDEYAKGMDDANDRRNFRNLLLLALAPKVPVSVTQKPRGGDEVETHTTAAKVLDGTKDVVTQAATQVREALGMSDGRVNSGRTPKHSATAPTQAKAAGKADPAATAPGPVAEAKAEDVFLHNLAAFLTDVAMLDRIKAVCAENGWRLAKAPAKK